MTTKRNAWWWTLTLVGCLAACSGSSDGDDTTPDAGSDASGDTDFVDTGDEETTPDVAEPDTAPDVSPEVTPDVPPDVAPDVVPDATPDVEEDIVPDVDVEEPVPTGPFACESVRSDGDWSGTERYVIWPDGRVASGEVSEGWGSFRYETDWDEEGRVIRDFYESFYREEVVEGEPVLEPDYRSEELTTWLAAPPSEARIEVYSYRSGSEEEDTVEERTYNEQGRRLVEEARRAGVLLSRSEFEPDWFGEAFEVRRDDDGDGAWDMEVEIEREEGRIVSAVRRRAGDSAESRWEFTYEGDDTRWKTRWYVDTSGIGSSEYHERTWLSDTRYEETRRTAASEPIELVRRIELDPATGIWTQVEDLYPAFGCNLQVMRYSAEGEYRGATTSSWLGVSGDDCIAAWRDGVPPQSSEVREYGEFGPTLLVLRSGQGSVFTVVTEYDEEGLLLRTRSTTVDAEGVTVQDDLVEAMVERDAAGRVTSWTFDNGEDEQFRTWTYDDEGRLLSTILDGYRWPEGSGGFVQEVEYEWADDRVAVLRMFSYSLEDGKGDPDMEWSMTYEEGFPYTLCSSDGEIPLRD